MHNTAVDFLRQTVRQQRLSSDEDKAMVADPIDEVHQRQAAAAGLRTLGRGLDNEMNEDGDQHGVEINLS